jgi:hypothetical protein
MGIEEVVPREKGILFCLNVSRVDSYNSVQGGSRNFMIVLVCIALCIRNTVLDITLCFLRPILINGEVRSS